MQRDVDRLMADAEAAARAGAFAVLLECIPQEAAAVITRSLDVPTIGIGAGPHCDGQVLVMHDLIGLSLGRVPRFARAYADVKGSMAAAIDRWRRDVEERTFPGPGETLG
jgi:3-methyl-2-oxobutanoate hydroxymethyltransferase